MNVKRIMVPLDGSMLAERALTSGAELARDASATLVLVRAVEAPIMLGSDPTEAHGRTGLARLMLGSVASRVVATAACPVFTVRGRG